MKFAAATGSGPGRIRALNRRAVLAHIRRYGPTSRTALGSALELSAAGVSSVVSELISDGLLRDAEAGPGVNRLGRPVALLELAPAAAYTFGLVLRPEAGKVRIESAWADYAGRVRVTPNPLTHDLDELQVVVAGVLAALQHLQESVPDIGSVAGLTIGTPGVVENEHIHIAPQLPVIEGDAFLAALRGRLVYSFELENDVNLAAFSELHQQPRLRDSSFAYLFIGSGVGAGLALRGQPWASHGWAGEIGQLRITRAAGRRESFEELLSTDTLAAKLEALGLPRDGFDELAKAIEARNRRTLRLIDTYAAHLCDLIQVLNAVLDLDEVILDFPSEILLQQLLPRVRHLIAESPLKVAISTPAMAHNAAVSGAALSSLHRALSKLEQRAER